MIVVKERKQVKTYYGVILDLEEIYSDSGKIILETTNGEKHSTDYNHTITIAQSRHNDYVEIDEPIEPFEEISEPIKEEEV